MKYVVNIAKEAEESKSTNTFQYIATCTGSIVIVCTGMTFGWATPSLPQLLAPESPIPITSDDGSWLAVMPCVGAAIGCSATATFVDKIGRKRSLLLASPLYFASWLMTAYATSIYWLHSARMTSGLADGIAFTAFPMYVGEIADSKIRGMLCSSIPVTTVMGFLLIAIISSHCDIKTAAVISSAFPIVHFLLFCLMPESPYYYLMKKKTDEARTSLRKLRGCDDVDLELSRLELAVEQENQCKGSWLDLFRTKSNRKGVYVVIGLRGLQQFCGAMAITFYATVIFNESESSLSSTNCTNVYFTIQMICSIICSVLVDRVGRKPLLILSMIGACMALATEGSYFYLRDYTALDVSELTMIPVIALLSYNVMFNLGMGTIPVVMLGELFPTNVKAVALCLADIYFGAVVIFVAKIFQIIKDSFGMHVPFLAFSISCVLSIFYVMFCIPETKGKTLEEIQEEFKAIKKIDDKIIVSKL